jgi:hypothetical protein
MATEQKRDKESVAEDLGRLLAAHLLVQLGGNWREDWERIATLRVLPRGVVLDSDEQFRFRLVSTDVRWEVWLGAAQYAVWCSWDGAVELSEGIAGAVEATGLPSNLLKEHAHALLVAAVKIRSVFLDESVM